MKREIEYVRSGGVAIACEVVGDGAVDLVYVPDYVSNLERTGGRPTTTRRAPS